MDIKKEIDKSYKLKENLKNIKNSINNELIEEASAYNYIPEKIEKTIKDYSKITKLNLNIYANNTNDPNDSVIHSFNQRIPISLYFIPQKVIILAKRVKSNDTNQTMYELIVDSDLHKDNSGDIKINKFTDEYIDITYRYWDYHSGRAPLSKYKFYEVIAIK